MCRFQSFLCFGTAVLSLTGLLMGCGKSRDGQVAATGSVGGSQTTPNTAASSAAGAGTSDAQSANPLVVLHTTQGDITLQLFPEKAPRTVENFLRGYVERGFYDQTIFHHMEKGRMLIGGGYNSDLVRK